jgi:hypothetical protein
LTRITTVFTPPVPCPRTVLSNQAAVTTVRCFMCFSRVFPKHHPGGGHVITAHKLEFTVQESGGWRLGTKKKIVKSQRLKIIAFQEHCRHREVTFASCLTKLSKVSMAYREVTFASCLTKLSKVSMAYREVTFASCLCRRCSVGRFASSATLSLYT